MDLIPFPASFNVGVTKFIPELVATGKEGGVTATYADPSVGVVVSASVQPGQMVKTDEDGVVRFYSYFTVNLLTDPSALNGGKGVRRGDAFWWDRDGRLLIAQDDAVKIGSVWPVRCLANQ